MSITTANDDVSEDALLGGKVRFLQPVTGYRAAIDPVLLAAGVAAKPGQRILDLGCGAGAVSLCLLSRCPGTHVTGVEISQDLAELARRNAALNGCVDRFDVKRADLAALPGGWNENTFDHVVMNPPYLEEERGTISPDLDRDRANREGGADLGIWIRRARLSLKHKGRLTLIHRADRLQDILVSLADGFGGIAILPLHPFAGKPANRVLASARKGVRSPLVHQPGMPLHDEGGGYSGKIAASLAGEPLLLDSDDPIFTP